MTLLGKLGATKSRAKGKPGNLKSRIENFLEARVNKPLPYVQKPGHKPSSLGSECLRKIYYAYYRTPRDAPISAFLARIFDTGNYYEDMVVSWLDEMGENIPYRNKGDGEIPKGFGGKGLNPQFPIKVPDWRIPKGYIDNVAVVNGKLWLREIKSKNTNKFDALEEVDHDHKVQVGIYFKAFNDHLAAGDYDHIPELKGFTVASGVEVIYVNKNTSNIRVFTLRPEALVDIIIDVDEKLEEVNPYIDARSLPPASKSTTNCQYCDWRKICKGNWNEIPEENPD